MFSVHTFSSSTGGCGNHLAVDVLDLGDSLADKGSVHFLVVFGGAVTVTGVSDKEDVSEFGELGQLGDLVPLADSVVADEEGNELGEGGKTFKLVNSVIRDPEFLKSGGDLFKTLNSTNGVSSEGEDAEVLELQKLNTTDHVGGEGELFDFLKDSEGLVHLVNAWDDSNELDFGGFGGGLTSGGFPILDGLLAGGWHIILKLIN